MLHCSSCWRRAHFNRHVTAPAAAGQRPVHFQRNAPGCGLSFSSTLSLVATRAFATDHRGHRSDRGPAWVRRRCFDPPLGGRLAGPLADPIAVRPGKRHNSERRKRIPAVWNHTVSLRLTLNPLLSRSLPVRIGEAGAPQFHSEEAHIVCKFPGDATSLDLGHYLAE